MRYLPDFAELKYILSTRGFQGACLLLVALWLVWGFLGKIGEGRDFSEREIVESTLKNIQIYLRSPQIEGNTVSAKEMLDFAQSMTPVWLGKEPFAYQGECSPKARELLSESGWCFDSARKELVFHPRNPENLQPKKGNGVLACQDLSWKISRARLSVPQSSDAWRIESTGSCTWPN